MNFVSKLKFLRKFCSTMELIKKPVHGRSSLVVRNYELTIEDDLLSNKIRALEQINMKPAQLRFIRKTYPYVYDQHDSNSDYNNVEDWLQMSA